MINHKDIDESFLSYRFKSNDWSKFFDPNRIMPHEWVNVPVGEVFTDEGLKYFENLNVTLRPTTRLFRLTENFVSPIHVDSDYYDSAFNFVLNGTHEMQWVTMNGGVESEGTYTQSNYTQGSYKRFDTFDSFTVDESWTGKCALVRINVPHRVIGGPELRYCVSVRPTENHFFNDLVSLF